MEKLLSNLTALILLFFLFLFPSTTVAKISDQELDAAFFALRSRGYTLFPNAIATTDLHSHILSSNSTFTLFSPPDHLLFSLDLSSTAAQYIHTLLLHVSPWRLSSSSLQRTRSGPRISTLSPNHFLSIGRSLAFVDGAISQTILLDGILVSVPDLFLGPRIVVHGLQGILYDIFRSDSDDGLTDYSDGLPFVSPDLNSWDSSSPKVESTTTDSRPQRHGDKDHHQQRNQTVDSSDGGGNGHGRFAKFNSQIN